MLLLGRRWGRRRLHGGGVGSAAEVPQELRDAGFARAQAAAEAADLPEGGRDGGCLRVRARADVTAARLVLGLRQQASYQTSQVTSLASATEITTAITKGGEAEATDANKASKRESALPARAVQTRIRASGGVAHRLRQILVSALRQGGRPRRPTSGNPEGLQGAQRLLQSSHGREGGARRSRAFRLRGKRAEPRALSHETRVAR